MKLKNLVIILRMSNNCNLNCAYCYDKNNHNNKCNENIYINNNIDKIVSNIVKLISHTHEKCKIIFHGGEPLMINASVYECLINKILEKIPKAFFSIQTNATLLTPNHINVFKRYNVSIGISLDGYNEKMNKCRVFKNGKNSFNVVMDKIKYLNKYSIKYGVIMSLSRDIIGHEEELYNFIYYNNINCDIRPVFCSLNRKQ